MALPFVGNIVPVNPILARPSQKATTYLVRQSSLLAGQACSLHYSLTFKHIRMCFQRPSLTEVSISRPKRRRVESDISSVEHTSLQ